MPLQKQEIMVQMGGGLDTKTDRKNVIPGKLLELKNGVFHELKQITKRNGFLTPWSLLTVDSNTIGAGWAVYRRSLELLITGEISNTDTGRISWEEGSVMLSHGPDENEWKRIGDREPVRLEVETIQRPTAQGVIPDVALADANKYVCYAWLGLKDPADATTNRHGHATVKELANDVNIIDDWDFGVAPIAAVDVQGIHVVGIDATNPIFYVWLAVPSTNDAYLAQINTLTLSAAGAPVIKITDLHEDMVWDVCTATHTTHGECSVVAYKESANGHLTISWFDEGGALVDTDTIATVVQNALTVFEAYDRLTATNKVITAYQIGAAPRLGWMGAQTYNAIGTVYAAEYYPLSRNLGTARNITGCKDAAADHYNWPARSYLRYYVEIAFNAANARPDWCTIVQAQAQFSGVSPWELHTSRKVCLGSKAWAHNSKPRCWFVHDSKAIIPDPPNPDIYFPRTQNTYFLTSPAGHDTANQDGRDRIDARCLGGEGGEQSFSQSLSAVVSPLTDRYTFAGLRRDILIGSSDFGDTWNSVIGVSTEFNQVAQPPTELGPTVQTGGGFVGDADGRFAENNFHLYPENLYSSSASGVSGVGADWFYTVVYEWTDREGQIHQSAPSIPVELVTPNDDDTVTILAPNLYQGDWDRLTETRLVLYRTLTGPGNVYYRLPTPSHILNDPTSIAQAALLDSPGGAAISDADLQEFPTLYTTGGVIANTCPPPTSIMNVRQDRVFLVPDEDRTNLWFSKTKRHAVAVSFSDLFTKRISDGGEITALATMDTREIVFKKSEIRAFSGPGPLDTGRGGFGEDYLITTDAGCTDRASVVKTDVGIMFKALGGIYLLGRNLQVSYIGAPVEDFNNYTVLKAELVEGKDQVRFLLEGQNMLVYDYYVKQWSVFEGPQPGENGFVPWDTVDSAIWQDNYVMIRDDGVVYREGVTWVDVVGTYVPLDFTTAWIKMRGLQGFQRLWWISLLGEVYGQCIITVEISYDYVDTVVQTVPITIDAAFAAAPPAQLRIKPAVQKCEAFKIRVYDAPIAVPVGPQQGFSLSEIALQIGKKRKGIYPQGGLKTR